MQSNTFFDTSIRLSRLDAVRQTHIVMTTYIADHLCRLCSPSFLAIIHRIIDDLWMRNTTHQTIHDTHFISWQAIQESTLLVIIERTTKRITHFVREYGNTRHLISICLHSQFFLWHLRSTCCPTFPINENSRINLV